MLAVLVLATVAAALPAATAAPATPGTQLKEIAHVHSTSACGEVAAHANAAIGDTLGNDALLGQTIAMLRGSDLDGNVVERRNALDGLRRLSDRLATQYDAGNDEVRRLRSLAARAATPAAKSNLLAFANWLGGALWRQKRIGRDLDGFIAAMDAKDMADFEDTPASMLDASAAQPNARSVRNSEVDVTPGLSVTLKLAPRSVTSPPQPAALADDQLARAAAADFALRTGAVQSDESMAAGHASALDSGC